MVGLLGTGQIDYYGMKPEDFTVFNSNSPSLSNGILQAQPQPQQNTSAGINPLSIGKGLLNSASGIKSAVNSFGASTLGFGNAGAPIGDVVGPTLPTGSGILGSQGATLGGSLGWAGIGATIGTYNPLVKNQMGGQVGGAIGGAIGNIVLPGIGGAIGGFLGSTIGGQFGSGVGTTASEFTGLVGGEGKFADLGFGSKNSDTSTAKNVANSTSNLLNLLHSNGVDTSGLKIRGGLNTQEAGGGFLDFGTPDMDDVGVAANRIKFNPSDPKSFDTALSQLGDGILKMKGAKTTMADLTAGQTVTTANGMTQKPLSVANNRQPEQMASFQQFVNDFRAKQKAGAV